MSTSKLTCVASVAAIAFMAGCSSGDYRPAERTVRIDPDGPERRTVVVVATPDESMPREARRSETNVVSTLQPAPVADIPAHVHAAAMKEVPGGDVVGAQQYAAGDVDVFDLRITAADGPHEVKVRDDGVVLLHRRNIATEVARVPSDEDARIASRP